MKHRTKHQLRDAIIQFLIIAALLVAGFKLAQNAKKISGEHPDAGKILCTTDGKAYKAIENFFTIFQVFRDTEEDVNCRARFK